ncbi:hypothetical protein [Telmatospirillum sp.]|uniref:hypothetical protein n=1 Tax=Telmatospirillum sp. TaxID=2079197 RepID=UPI00283F6C7D|nr:hypothetical protein [Telmatospirillum sp.]MDR3439806.1 hypothetical protein [Telmatospirillum sp.]
MVGASLDTIRLQNLGELPRGNVALTIYPATDDGEILIDQGIAIVAIVRSKNEYAIRLTFKHTTYPFSKMIIRFLSARQGIEPYHVKIGL